MKPTNKIQREIVLLSRKLKPITNRQMQYAYRHCIEPFAKRTAKVSIPVAIVRIHGKTHIPLFRFMQHALIAEENLR